MVPDIGDLTQDVGFKFVFKDPSLKRYVAMIVSGMLNLDCDYTYENMQYLDVEFPKNIKSLMRSDVVIKINNIIVIFEMNRTYYEDLVELKIRYSNHIFDKMFFKAKKKYHYNKTKIILVMINAFYDKESKGIATYKPINEYVQVLSKYLEVKEYNLDKIKELWYNGFTISKYELYLLYLIMTREEKEVISKFVEGDEILSEAEKNRIDLMNGKICLDYDVEIENEIVKQGLMEAGRAEGRKQNNRDNAKKMKENGIAIDLISKITGLSKKQIMML